MNTNEAMRSFCSGRLLSRVGMAVCLWVFTQTVALAQQNIIKRVEGSNQAGIDVVKIEMATPMAALPEGFIVQSPARIAFDFSQNASEVPRQINADGKSNLKSIHVVQAGDRTRLILNLKQSANYEAKLDGKDLYLYVKNTPSQVPSVPTPADRVMSDATALAPIGDIDFRKAGDSAGKVVVSLPSNQVSVDVQQQGQSLLVQFAGTSLPEGLRRRLDVSDFGTPVQSIVTTQVGNKVNMVIDPKGSWEHSAYQAGNQFVLEIRERKEDPGKLTQGPGYSGEKLSLNFQNIEIRSLLQVIADFTNFNIVTSESVSGAVTLRLKDVPWDQALDIILQAKGLGVKKTGNVLLVAPKEELIARDKQELEARVNVESLEQLKTQVFQLKFAKAADVMPRLNSQTAAASAQANAQGQPGSAGGSVLSSRGSASADPRTNQLFVTDIPSRLAEVQSLLAKIDVPVRQVVIEARIVEANDSFGRSIGVRLGGADLRGVRGGDAGYGIGGGNRVAIGGSYDAVSNSTGNFGSTAAGAFSNFVNLPITPPAGVSDSAVSSLALTLFNPTANRLLSLEIQAMEAEGKGTIVSSPRLMTADQVTAIIEQGKEIPYTIISTTGAPVTAYKKAVMKLEVTPQITPDGSVILDLQINKDSQGSPIAAGVVIDTKAIKTQAIVQNGGTVMLGGIFESTESNSETKVPLLGDLPVIGNLFKSRSLDTSRKETLVFITPRILNSNEIGN